MTPHSLRLCARRHDRHECLLYRRGGTLDDRIFGSKKPHRQLRDQFDCEALDLISIEFERRFHPPLPGAPHVAFEGSSSRGGGMCSGGGG